MKFTICITLVTFVKFSSMCGEFRGTVFTPPESCPGDGNPPVIFKTTKDNVAPSRCECVVACVADPSCIAVSVCPSSTGGFECKQFDTTFNESCTDLQMAPGCEQIQPMCKNGGIFNSTVMKCDCPYDYTGIYCERRFRDCTEAYEAGLRASGSNYLDLHIRPIDAPKVLLVECNLAWGGYTVVEVRQVSCQSDYNRTWEEFKTGWITSCSRWIGLEALHYITNKADLNCSMVVNAKMADVGSGQGYYHGISIGNESTNYTLDYLEYSGHKVNPVGNGFAFGGATKSIKGKGFATSDRPDPNGCAMSSGAGWWYGDECPDTNLNRRMSNDAGDTSVAKWPDVNGTLRVVSHMKFQMKVLREP